ncbi:MAG TPA: hypothetical protein VFI42_00680 [Thermomicrobiaceae bacterium]|nr:hypothetical protein [Thermomicrobiaceae bacterium]
METVFLICFVFGAAFALLSLLLGFAGHTWHVEHLSHVHLHHDVQVHHGGGHDAQLHADQGEAHLPIFNVSALLAFLTWFGGAGYLLTRLSGWPLLLVLPGAVVIGLAGAAVIGLILAKIMAGEQVMNPRDYQLEGTLARVTVSIPAGGVGEIIFSKAGSRRGEAARSVDGRAIPRDTEVVVIDYVGGVALVESWEQLVNHRERVPLAGGR